MISVILIRNDHLHAICDDPEFGRELFLRAQYGSGSFYHDYAEVIAVSHISGQLLIEVKDGHGRVLDHDEQRAIERARKRNSKKRICEKR